ncbi:MAG: DUF21 domain-containing protein [Opitutaceae bacterium]|nr:DUF21 domain-containing protein [Verrucomicrobiales bacterium]
MIVIIVGVSIIVSFLLSGLEAGVQSLNRLRIRQLARKGNRSAVALHHYLDTSEEFLWTIFVGNTMANFTAISLIAVSIYRHLNSRPWFGLAAFLVAIFLFYTLCELLPKTLFRLFPNRLSLFFIRPFHLFRSVLRPVVSLTTWFAHQLLRWTGGRRFTGQMFGNREELRFVMQESSAGLTSEERAMINRVLDLQGLAVRHVMTPLAKTVTVQRETPMSDVLKLCRERNLTRLPVCETTGNRTRVTGLVSLKEILYRAEINPAHLAGQYVTPALFLEESVRLEEALRRMQRSGRRLAIVLDGDQREIGIISLEDILNMIFGEVKL